ncbi:MAG TPA: NAD(P)/FAD-dependent oxidoreductase, partial [Nocardioides sp.]|nr:NAD(P)/FAD-dependent oxidoreductase [Nocardioides sp.]
MTNESTARTYDAIVVGAGPNGLVAANRLADAGWSVLVLEEQSDVGGAVRHDRELHPDFVHDTFSAFYPLAAASASIESFGLDEHGLSWCHAPAVLGHPMPDGEWAILHRDREVTAALMERQHRGDGDSWLALCRTWDLIGDQLVESLLTPFPPVKGGAGVLRRLRRVGGLEFVKTMLMPAIDLGRAHFGGEAGRLLLAGNAGHSDIPLDAPGSGFLGLLLSMLGQTVGFPVPQGGAGEFSAALAHRLEALGGVIRCSAPVVEVEVADGRVGGVRIGSGE